MIEDEDLSNLERRNPLHEIEPSPAAIEAGMWAIGPHLYGFDMTQAAKAAMLKDLYRSMRGAELMEASGLTDAKLWDAV